MRAQNLSQQDVAISLNVFQDGVLGFTTGQICKVLRKLTLKLLDSFSSFAMLAWSEACLLDPLGGQLIQLSCSVFIQLTESDFVCLNHFLACCTFVVC
jgi:hypothetical protein